MAKKAVVVNEEPLQEVEETLVEAPEDAAPEEVIVPEVKPVVVKPTVVAPKEAVATPSTKSVRVHLTEDVNSFIGGTHYTGRKDRDLVVPSDVAAILVNGRKAYRI